MSSAIHSSSPVIGVFQRLLCLGLLLAGCSVLTAGTATAGDPAGTEQEKPRVDFTWGVKIPMRDGVELNATVYRPKGAGPLPVIFHMTPYISNTYHPLGMHYAKSGYVAVIVDDRGRGNSGGVFHPFLQDAKDGYDAVEWLAKQPWSNGKIAMFGGSYGGANQWSTAKELPPHLASIVPTAPGYFGLDFPGVNNILRSYDMQWLTFTSGRTGNTNLFGDSAFWSDFYHDLYQGKVTFRQFDAWVGNPSPIYQNWMNHPTLDAYWDSIVPTVEQYRAINLPILSITGHYDGDQPGTLEFYRRHMASGSAAAKSKHFLVIGPWDHGGTRDPQPTVGGLAVGDASLWDMGEFSREWYDWTLKDGPRPERLTDRVVYFVAAANSWKSAAQLDDIGVKKQLRYLDPQSTSGSNSSPTVYQSGGLSLQPPKGSDTVYFVDDPLATEKILALEQSKAVDYQNPEWVIYQDNVLAIEEDGLVYHTEPFAAPTEISGFVTLQLWLSMDVPDTDMRASLYEIFPDGRSILLTNDMLRARYRHSLREETLVKPGEIERYDFNRFLFFSRVIGKGSRLRLVIDGNDNSAWQQNYNSGGVVVDETPADARKATITLYQDAKHRSVLSLPLGD